MSWEEKEPSLLSRLEDSIDRVLTPFAPNSRVVAVGVGILIYGLFSIFPNLSNMLSPTESMFEHTQRAGNRTQGTMTRELKSSTNFTTVEVVFDIGDPPTPYRGSVTVFDQQKRLKYPTSVTVIYEPDDLRQIFIENYGDPYLSSGNRAVPFLQSVAALVGGILLIYFFGIRYADTRE